MERYKKSTSFGTYDLMMIQYSLLPQIKLINRFNYSAKGSIFLNRTKRNRDGMLVTNSLRIFKTFSWKFNRTNLSKRSSITF